MKVLTKPKGVRDSFRDETYGGVERLIWQQIHKFRAKHGDAYGTPDELFSEAGAAFVRAYDDYDPTKGAFTTHVQWRVTTALMRLRTDPARKASRGGVPGPLTIDVDQKPDRWRGFLSDLSEDARMVVMLLVESPPDFSWAEEVETISESKRCAKQSQRSAFGVRLLVREYLFARGWKRCRVNRSFKELGEAVA